MIEPAHPSPQLLTEPLTMNRSLGAALPARSASLRNGCWATCLSLPFAIPAAASQRSSPTQPPSWPRPARAPSRRFRTPVSSDGTAPPTRWGTSPSLSRRPTPRWRLILDEGTAINPGNEVLMSSVEDLDVIIDHPVYSLGFYFVEGNGQGFCSNPCPCTDATFHVTLRLHGVQVGAFAFKRARRCALVLRCALLHAV